MVMVVSLGKSAVCHSISAPRVSCCSVSFTVNHCEIFTRAGAPLVCKVNTGGAAGDATATDDGDTAAVTVVWVLIIGGIMAGEPIMDGVAIVDDSRRTRSDVMMIHIIAVPINVAMMARCTKVATGVEPYDQRYRARDDDDEDASVAGLEPDESGNRGLCSFISTLQRET